MCTRNDPMCDPVCRTNPRNYTVVVNNGVTRSENLSGMMSFSLDQSEATPQMVETLTEEVNRISAKEEEAIGLEECFKKVCKVRTPIVKTFQTNNFYSQ